MEWSNTYLKHNRKMEKGAAVSGIKYYKVKSMIKLFEIR